MFEHDVASALFRYTCCLLKPEPEIAAMVEAFCQSKRQRASQVTQEQQQSMYVTLRQQMDVLPSIFIRDKCGVIHDVITGGYSYGLSTA